MSHVVPHHRELLGSRTPIVIPMMASTIDRGIITSQRKELDYIGQITSVARSITSNTLGRLFFSRSS